MSDLPQDALSYQAVVAEYFLALRGAGLMLSPLDQDLVAEWERRGVPVAVVCRGLRRGLGENFGRRGPGAAPPRSIRTLRLAIEDEWRAYQRGRVGEAGAPPGEDAAAAARLEAARALLEDAERRAGSGPACEGYRYARRALDEDHAGTPLERVESALAEADARILAAWNRGLPPEVRAALGPRIRLLAGPRARGTSPRAHRAALRAHLLDTARESGLNCLRGTV